MNIRKIEMRKRRFLKPWRFLVQAAGSLYLVPRILRAPLSLGLPSYSSSQPLYIITNLPAHQSHSLQRRSDEYLNTMTLSDNMYLVSIQVSDDFADRLRCNSG